MVYNRDKAVGKKRTSVRRFCCHTVALPVIGVALLLVAFLLVGLHNLQFESEIGKDDVKMPALPYERLQQTTSESANSSLSAAAMFGPTVDDNQGTIQVQCSLPLPMATDNLSYERGSYTEVWRATSEQDCASYAAELLILLKSAKAKLVSSGYLDLFGMSWGCAIKTEQNEAYTIGVFSSGDKKLLITVVHIFTYEGDL